VTTLVAAGSAPEALYRVPAQSNRTALTRFRPAFFPDSGQHYLMLLIIVLFPFQIFGLNVGTTKFDLANIAFAAFAAWVLLSVPRLGQSSRFKLFFGIYLTVEIIMFFAGPAPPARFGSAFLWVTSVVVLFGLRDHIPINARAAFWLTLSCVALVAMSLLFGSLILGEDRPAGLMAEPSPAGLALLGASAGLLISVRWAPNRPAAMLSIGGAAILFVVSFLTKTTHILSFAAALVSLGVLSRSFSVRTAILSVVALGVLYWLFTYDPHYQSRVNVSAASSNLSLLSWLQGYDQMVASLHRYPVLGAGLGGTGQFEFFSGYSVDLFRAGIGDLNRQDAFCGLFRLTIELGPVLMAVVLYAISLRLRQLWRSTGEGLLPVGLESQAQMFLFTFGFTLVIGFMLKEPTYSRSHIVLGALLFTVIPLRAVVDVPRRMALQLRPTGL
jgi:hypothetical protein